MKVQGDTADEKRGVQTAAKEEPCKQGSGSGLAMGAGYHGRAPLIQEHLFNQSGEGEIGYAPLENSLYLGVPPRDGVADHHEIGGGVRCTASYPCSTLTLLSCSS